MTWLAYEMARHPQLQARLHAEVDAMFDAIGDRDMTFADCKRMPFLTQCVMETLRKWTAVPNGTFRELQYDEHVTGVGGRKVLLEKGTYVQVDSALARGLSVSLPPSPAKAPCVDGVVWPSHPPARAWQVVNWTRQRNPTLWEDPEAFNPDRAWAADEIWNNRGFAATNPATKRFSPFTYAPRHCLGMNFAQMEMRT